MEFSVSFKMLLVFFVFQLTIHEGTDCTMATQEELCETLIEWERKNHSEVFRWIQHRGALDTCADPAILDFSMDSAIFSQLLTEKVKAKHLTATVRSKDQPPLHVVKPSGPDSIPMEIKDVDISGTTYDHLASLGKFDLIICKDMLYGVEDLGDFFTGLKGCMKDEEKGKIFIISRPKNPPVPIPDNALGTWRKLAPGREEIITAADKGGWKHDTYSASCPIKVDKNIWGRILLSRCIPAVRFTPKCTDKEIREFISTRPKQMVFEEKIMIIVLYHGDKPAESDMVANA